MRVGLRGGSVIDGRRLHFQNKEEVDHYLRLCLFDPDDPFDRARLQRILDEAVDYLRTSFRYRVAEEVARPRELQDLFLLASGAREPQRLRRIACIVLKVMHVVHHVEARGLLHRARVSEDELAQLVTGRVDYAIGQLRRAGMPILAAAGSVKTRHSLITKLLAKKETLAAQIYDRVRYRVVTAHRDDVLPVLVRLCDVLVPFNFVVPGQTQNTLFSFRRLVRDTPTLRKLAPELQAGLHLEEHDRREGNAPPANELTGDDCLGPAVAGLRPAELTEQSSSVDANLRAVIAVSNDVAWASGSGGTWLRTVDGGVTWRSGAVAGAEALDFRSLAAFDAHQAILLNAGGPARMFRTDDGAKSWRAVYRNDTAGIFFDALAFADRSRGYALGDPVAGRFVLIETSDGGESWHELPGPEAKPGEGAFAASNSCLVVRGDDLWFATGGSVARVFHSADRGRSWSAADAPAPSGAPSR